MRALIVCVGCCFVWACEDGGGGVDAAAVADGSPMIDAANDAATVDAAVVDAAVIDAAVVDAAVIDAAVVDAPVADAAVADAASVTDAATTIDANTTDGGVPPGPCSSVQLVSAGAEHTCVVTDTGGVRCWGADGSTTFAPQAELGYGRSNSPGLDNYPSDAGDVYLGTTASDVSAGYRHTCAVVTGGDVMCWGLGDYGRLGYGNEDSVGRYQLPASVGAIVLGATAVKVGAGAEHSCALTDTGTVRCWGRSQYGQLGYGNIDSIGDDELVATAGDVNVGGTVTQLSVGADHTCALLMGGTVRCWGRNGDGRLGYGTVTPVGDDESPASMGDVSVGGVVSQIATGASHTCALLMGGAVRCWGQANLGQLGYGNGQLIGDNETPASAGDVPIGGTATAIAAGGNHTCALLSTGEVRCWGEDFVGGPAIGDNEPASAAPAVSVGASVSRISIGVYHACVELAGGATRCWGQSNDGQLGYANATSIASPAAADDVRVCWTNQPPGSFPVTRVVTGGYHSCAILTGGVLRCWGRNDVGQLGYGHTNDIGDDELPSTVGNVDVGGVVIDVALGPTHTCALLMGGNVRCWGSGSAGKLGYGNTQRIGDDELPSSVGYVDIGGTATALAAGTNHTCAVLTGGSVVCWGSGSHGKLGYANTNNIGDNETPASAGTVNVGGVVTQIGAGDRHTCALLMNGAVRCWGSGANGRLGYGNTSSIGDDEVPAAAGDVSVGGTVSQLAVWGRGACALVGSDVVCWGENGYGQLGYGNTTTIGDNEAPSTAGTVNIGSPVAEIAGGGGATGGYNCARTTSGQVYCWGAGSALGYGYAQFNQRVGDDESPASAGPLILGGTADQLSAGDAAACARMTTGAVRCWGDYRALGYGETRNVGNDETPASAGDVQVQ